MAEDSGEKTEEPTPKRIEDARKKGNVANSRDLSGVVVMAGALLAFATFASADLGENLSVQARGAWGGGEIRPTSLADFHAVLLNHFALSARAFIPLALVLVATGAAISLAQTGPLLSAEALAFRGSRMDPIKGVKRLVDGDRLFDLGKAPLKIAAVGVALWAVIRAGLDGVLALIGAPVAATLSSIDALATRAALLSLVGLALLAVLDLAWVRLRYRKRLRMSLREVRDEMREREGSPQVKSRRKAVQRELSRQRMISDVARADVVITNPTHYAVALRYVRGEMNAPTVVARGRNHVAFRIRAVARENDVPIVENPPLARVLYRTAKLGREIPESLFEAVAEVLAYVVRLDERRGRAWSASP